jgi:hypothetical protein
MAGRYHEEDTEVHVKGFALLVLGSSQALAAARVADDGIGHLLRAVNQPMTATCEADWRPERAVLVGGVSASALKPTEARAALERQLDAIRHFAGEKRATLRLLERTRAVRGGSRDQARPGPEAPFVTVQRLELEAPVEADVDTLLEGLLKLGLDVFGREPVLDPALQSGYRPTQAVVRYRIGDLRDKAGALHDRCRGQAMASWCAASAPASERQACTDALARFAEHFQTQSFQVQSAPVPRVEGGAAPVRLSGSVLAESWHVESDVAPQGSDEVDLLGLVSLPVRGTITIQLVGGR